MLRSAMFSLSPRATLGLLIGLAGVLLASGLRLARQEESVRLDRDREPLQRFSGEVRAELQRLEALYESHLGRLARTPKPDDAFEVRRDADRIIGIRQYSLLHREAKGTQDLHVQLTTIPRERTPIPMFDAPRGASIGIPVLLGRELLFDSAGPHSGWIEEPGKPLMYWHRISSNEAVVLIDRYRRGGGSG